MHTFMVPCLLGLEKLVGDEIRRLGLKDVQVENGRVLCRGELSDLARLNINLRCGARVLGAGGIGLVGLFVNHRHNSLWARRRMEQRSLQGATMMAKCSLREVNCSEVPSTGPIAGV